MLSDRCPVIGQRSVRIGRTPICPVLSCLSAMLVYFGQTVGWIKTPLDMEIGLSPCHIVLDGDPAPPHGKGHSIPHFRGLRTAVHVYCGQMAECIKMPLGTEVGLGTGDIMLDGDPAPPRKRAQRPPLWPTLLWYGRPSQQLLKAILKYLDCNGHFFTLKVFSNIQR